MAYARQRLYWELVRPCMTFVRVGGERDGGVRPKGAVLTPGDTSICSGPPTRLVKHCVEP